MTIYVCIEFCVHLFQQKRVHIHTTVLAPACHEHLNAMDVFVYGYVNMGGIQRFRRSTHTIARPSLRRFIFINRAPRPSTVGPPSTTAAHCALHIDYLVPTTLLPSYLQGGAIEYST